MEYEHFASLNPACESQIRLSSSPVNTAQKIPTPTTFHYPLLAPGKPDLLSSPNF